jgi:hypothetical protein
MEKRELEKIKKELLKSLDRELTKLINYTVSNKISTETAQLLEEIINKTLKHNKNRSQR